MQRVTQGLTKQSNSLPSNTIVDRYCNLFVEIIEMKFPEIINYE
jgi:hypothetical protein